MQIEVAGRRLALSRGDITQREVDAIVNAANTRLQHGGGVALAISRAGGPEIQRESDRIGHCPRGGAVLTSAGRLPARWVIHTVGPVAGDGDERQTLVSCVRSVLALAEREQLRSVCFPAISTGIYGVPVALAAEALLGAAHDHLAAEGGSLELVEFCLYSQSDLEAFQHALGELGRPG